LLKTWTTSRSRGPTPEEQNPEDSPPGKPVSSLAPKEKEAKAKLAETSLLSSAATATSRDTCKKSATPGSTRTPPVLTTQATHASWPQLMMSKMQK
jgi:hypothetical protein